VEGDDCFTTSEKDIKVIGRYQVSLDPALVEKNNKDFNNIFCASGYISAEVLRDIAKQAGVHIYSYSSDNVVYVNSEMIGVYHRNGKDAEIFVKEDGEYVDLFTNKQYVSENKKITLICEEDTANKCLIKCK
jgi:hypothetical protein